MSIFLAGLILAFDTPDELKTLLGISEVFAAGLVTITIEAARRWAKRKMDIWEADNPVPKAVDDDVEES